MWVEVSVLLTSRTFSGLEKSVELGTLGILNTNSQIVLRTDLFLPETMNYNVKCNLINSGFNPRAAAVLRLRATQRIFQSSLKGAGLTANAPYQLLINDIVAQMFSADSKGKFNLKSLVTERAAVDRRLHLRDLHFM